MASGGAYGTSSYTMVAATQADFWFDACVIYVRVTNCATGPDCAVPEALTMHFPAREIAICMEVNGARIAPSEEASLVLRRNRIDAEKMDHAVIYVSTDNLRTSSTLRFRILDHGGTVIVSGTLERVASSPRPANHRPIVEPDWAMASTCEIGAHGCAFVRAKHELLARHHNNAACISSFPSGSGTASMEVCVVGRFMSEPMILTQTVPLTARRRSSAALGTLIAIPEDNEVEKDAVPLPAITSTVMTPLDFFDHEEGEVPMFFGMTTSSDDELKHKALMVEDFDTLLAFDGSLYITESDQEETWYNRGISRGIKLGLGIGIGMCVGLGIGLGLILRTYRATTKSLNRIAV